MGLTNMAKAKLKIQKNKAAAVADIHSFLPYFVNFTFIHPFLTGKVRVL